MVSMNKKRLFGMFAFSLLAISFMVSFSSAGPFDPVRDMFASWEEGDLSLNIAKYLFLFLVAIVIFNVLEFVPILGGKGPIKWIVAFLVSFLATAYLSTSDIYTMLAGYGALGMVVGGIIPFLILMAFSVQISKGGKKNRGGQLFAKFMWFAFIIFLVWKLVEGMYYCELGTVANENVRDCINMLEGWIYVGLIVAGIVWIWFMEKWVINLLFKNKLESDVEYSGHKADRRKAMQDIKDREAEAEFDSKE